ncbi:MAG: DNA-processing protein DprA [Nitrospinae bacterium]|nr:DNA-processing protein DprA [Nitrospinota bacterium]
MFLFLGIYITTKYKIIILAMTNLIKINKGDDDYPEALNQYLCIHAPKTVTAVGKRNILQNKKLAIFCSVKCPGNIILKTYDLIKKLKESSITVISGFHSPMDSEFLNILLKGKQQVIICPARDINGMRIKAVYKKHLEDGRLLFLSTFTKKERRISSEKALLRNRFVAAIADSVFIPYTEPKSKTEKFYNEISKWDKQIYSLENMLTMDL